MLINEEKIIRNDSMLMDIVVSVKTINDSIFQCKKEQTKITKCVYKKHNEVFNINRSILEAPKCKCEFTLHTDNKSSYVVVYDRNNNEIFRGNSLWQNSKHETEEKHIDFIKLLHSVEDVKQKYDC